MTTLLIHNAHTIATQDDARTELRNASILVRNALPAPLRAEEATAVVLDAIARSLEGL